MNLNELAKEICKIEGGKKNLPIAQVKEVLKSLGSLLGTLPGDEAMALIQKIIKAGK